MTTSKPIVMPGIVNEEDEWGIEIFARKSRIFK